MRWPVLYILTLLAATCGLISQAEADSSQTVSGFDEVWDAAVLYKSEDNPTIQSFALVGRYHGQAWNVDADQGNAQDWENRREIFGFKSRWTKSLAQKRTWSPTHSIAKLMLKPPRNYPSTITSMGST